MDTQEIRSRQQQLDDLRHTTEDGVEFWYARGLMGLLGHTSWQYFGKAIHRAKESCESSKTPVKQHFNEVVKSSPMPKGGVYEMRDYMLTRYARYLIAMNGDTRKEEIAFVQSHFAM